MKKVELEGELKLSWFTSIGATAPPDMKVDGTSLGREVEEKLIEFSSDLDRYYGTHLPIKARITVEVLE